MNQQTANTSNLTINDSYDLSGQGYFARVKKDGFFRDVKVVHDMLTDTERQILDFFENATLDNTISLDIQSCSPRLSYLNDLFYKTYNVRQAYDDIARRNDELATFINSTTAHLPWVLKNKVIADVVTLESKQTFALSELKSWTIKTVYDLEERYRSNDVKSYLDLHRIDYEKLLLKDYIHLACITDPRGINVYSIAKCTLDGNGLKAVDDYGPGGHEAGHEMLSHISMILKSGRTSSLLRHIGVQVCAFAEGGDEFGLVLLGNVDLRPVFDLLTQAYQEEMYGTDVSHLLDLEHEELRKLFLARDINPKPGDAFKLSCSAGWTTLGDALESLDSSEEDTYVDAMNRLVDTMFRTADALCMEHKKDYKNLLSERGQSTLHAIYTLRSDVDYTLALKARIEELEDENRLLKDKLVSLSF
jgi:GGDEF domain-containing protein